MNILITGVAGFIGFHLCKKLIINGNNIIGIDNINDYYDINLKETRLKELLEISNNSEGKFEFFKGNLEDNDFIKNLFSKFKPKKVVNLAAQAGVRYSIENPSKYIQSNIVGFANILEACREQKVEHLIYASSSSVYGGNTSKPFLENENVDHPVSLYAATKKSNELMAHTYSHLYNLPTTGLRFFTVYGPWGRPDMALFKFTKAILNNEPIDIYNYGNMVRDFTYVDDVAESLVKLIFKIPRENKKFDTDFPTSSSSWAPYLIFNIGNSNPIKLKDFIEEIEKSLGVKAIKNYLPMQMGDVPETSSSTKLLEEWIGYKPTTKISEGISNFIKWYKMYYKV
jgi:UDP-glucuronate 4-epimerase